MVKETTDETVNYEVTQLFQKIIDYATEIEKLADSNVEEKYVKC